MVGGNPTPYGILALWAVNGLSIVYWEYFRSTDFLQLNVKGKSIPPMQQFSYAIKSPCIDITVLHAISGIIQSVTLLACQGGVGRFNGTHYVLIVLAFAQNIISIQFLLYTYFVLTREEVLCLAVNPCFVLTGIHSS